MRKRNEIVIVIKRNEIMIIIIKRNEIYFFVDKKSIFVVDKKFIFVYKRLFSTNDNWSKIILNLNRFTERIPDVWSVDAPYNCGFRLRMRLTWCHMPSEVATSSDNPCGSIGWSASRWSRNASLLHHPRVRPTSSFE